MRSHASRHEPQSDFPIAVIRTRFSIFGGPATGMRTFETFAAAPKFYRDIVHF